MIAFGADNSPGDSSRDRPGQILQIPADHPTLQPLFVHVCVVMCMIAALLFTHSCLLASALVCVSACVFTLLSVGVCFFKVFLWGRERLWPSCTHGHTVWRQTGAVSPLRDVEGPWGWREGLNEGEENKGGTDSGSDWHVKAVLFCYQLLKVCQRPHCTLEPLSGLRYVYVCLFQCSCKGKIPKNVIRNVVKHKLLKPVYNTDTLLTEGSLWEALLSLRRESLNIHGHCHSLAYSISNIKHVFQKLNQYIVFVNDWTWWLEKVEK